MDDVSVREVLIQTENVGLTSENSSLNEHSTHVVDYIAGFCAKQIQVNLDCTECIDLLIDNDMSHKAGLILIKDVNNALTVPSEFLKTICRHAEKVIKQNFDLVNAKKILTKLFILTLRSIGLHFFHKFDLFFLTRRK